MRCAARAWRPCRGKPPVVALSRVAGPTRATGREQATVKPNCDKHRRRSIRLKGHDYTHPGAYFVTVCVQNRECLLGEIVEGTMIANGPGRMVQSVWNDIPAHYSGVGIDAFVVMPNHIHGIVTLATHGMQAGGLDPLLSLPDVVHRFKSLTTSRYISGFHHEGWLPFDRRLWQRNYYEHVVRSERELERIREYIVGNPAKWEEDENNPANL